MGTGGPSPQSTPTYFSLEKKSKQKKLQSVFFSLPFFSTVSNYILFCRLCQELSIKVLFAYFLFQEKVSGDPYRIRTDVNGVRGRCLNHLTNGPLVRLHGFEPGTHWLRVSCSTSWAKGAYFLSRKKVCKESFHRVSFLLSCLLRSGGAFCTLKTEQCRFSVTLCKRLHCFLLRSSPRLISTGQLHTLLHFHLRPINDVVYIEPYLMKSERSYLRGSFTLRCFQRLSRPDVATQLCPDRKSVV